MLAGLIKTTEETQTIAISLIRRDGGTQPRQGMNEDVVTDYVAALGNGAAFPPVDVMFDGDVYWLFDGFHRVEAHLRSGATTILAKSHPGTLEQAQWRSYAANQSHGLRRSTADKERSVRLALKHPNAPGMSDNALAKHLGVDHKTIAKYRGEMQSTWEIPKSETRTGADGRSINTTNIGKNAAKPPPAPPPPPLPDRPLPAWAEPEAEPELRPLPLLRMTEAQYVDVIQAYLASKSDAPDRQLDYLILSTGHYEYFQPFVPLGYLFATLSKEFENAFGSIRRRLKIAEDMAKAESAPAPRVLDAMETMSVVWKAVKAEAVNSVSITLMERWQHYADWLNTHNAPGDYRQYAPIGTQMDAGTLIKERHAVIAELRRNIEHDIAQKRAAVPVPVSEMPAETEAYYEDDELVLPVAHQRLVEPPVPQSGATPPPAAVALPVGRNPGRSEQLNAAVADCRAFYDRLEEVGRLTGNFTAMGRAQRAIDDLVESLRRNLV